MTPASTITRRFTRGGTKVHEILVTFKGEFVSLDNLVHLTDLAPSSVTREIAMLRLAGVVVVNAHEYAKTGLGWDRVPVGMTFSGDEGYAFVGYEEDLTPRG